MALKIGDKVRYLDSKGGGTVTAFKGKDQVLVLEEDGFETPVLARQCVVIESEESSNRSEKKQTREEGGKETKVLSLRKKKPSKLSTDNSLKVYLAFLAEEGKSFDNSSMESYLINDSSFHVLYHIALVTGNAWQTLQSGLIEPDSKMYLETFERKEVPERERIHVQLIVYKKDAFYVGRQPVSCELRLEQAKFYKIHCFRQNDYFDDDALLFPVVDQ